MNDYVKRSDVEEMLEKADLICDANGEFFGYCTEDVKLSLIPSADVKENKHGDWKKHYANNFHYCSECFNYAIDVGNDDYPIEILTDFCPSCGANMRGEDYV
jgi:hypothetical protein